MAFPEIFNFGISILVAALNIFLLIALLIYFIIKIKWIKEPQFYKYIKNIIKEKNLLLIFIVSLIATLGSLVYSEILGYNPCKLCWFQRIFMYPITILSGFALLKKEDTIKKYILLLSTLGALIALYHYAMQFLPQIVACTIEGANCAEKQSLYFGYITIPMMAFSAFITIMLLSLAKNANKSTNQSTKDIKNKTK